MSAPLVPSPLDYIGPRRFAFYPPIKNAEPNEWLLGTGSWTDVQIVNAKTGGKIWIPRQFIGGVSDSHEGLLVVGLTKELEYRSGALGPRFKHVIEMPLHVELKRALVPPDPRPPGPAPVIGIRVEDREDSPMSRALVTLAVAAIVVALIAAVLAVFDRFQS
ncbi:MAG: hypothetical protein JO051_15440 [Acidobacteriaceae bacterium]|nr:hypothetical protein [Acidobacteriaceae bacterium]